MSPDLSASLSLVTGSPAETRELARRLGQLAAQGWLVLLEGPLGAGKTAFAQGLLAGLGVQAAVTSPTFTLVNEYHGRMPAWHVDLYRFDNAADDFLAIGGDELLPPSHGLAVIEWADRLGSLSPADHILVRITAPADGGCEEQRRELRLEFRGRRYAAAAAALGARAHDCPAQGVSE